MLEGYETIREAKSAAEKHTKATDEPTFVYQVTDCGETRFDWCTDHEYRYTSHQWVREDKVIWGSCDGWY
jgi:hypothetical protein